MGAYTVSQLLLPSSSDLGADPSDLNNAGMVVGDVIGPETAEGTQAATWYAGASTLLATPDLPGSSMATHMNELGDIVGLYGTYPDASHIGEFPKLAFAQVGGQMLDLAPIVGYPNIFAHAINDLDVVVGGMGNDDLHYRAFRLSLANQPYALEDLGIPEGYTSATARAIDDTGRCAVVASNQEAKIPQHAFLFENGAYQDLGESSDLWELSETGWLVGSRYLGQAWQTGFRYNVHTPQTPMETIPPLARPGHVGTNAFGVNNAGVVVGDSFADLEQDFRAFIYDGSGGGPRDLNDLIDAGSGWVLESADAINDAGQIVGTGTLNGDGHQAFLLTPVGVRQKFPWESSLVLWILFGIVQDGGGVAVTPRGGPVPVGPWGWERLTAAERDLLSGLALARLGAQVQDHASRAEAERVGHAIMERALNQLNQLNQMKRMDEQGRG